MHKRRLSFVDRRGFLRFGAVAGLLVAAGCDGGGGEPAPVTTPPLKGGARNRLDVMKDKGDSVPTKKK